MARGWHTPSFTFVRSLIPGLGNDKVIYPRLFSDDQIDKDTDAFLNLVLAELSKLPADRATMDDDWIDANVTRALEDINSMTYIPLISYLAERETQAIAHLRLTRALCAIYLNDGAVAGEIKDPYDEQPLRSNATHLWSIGPDGVDQQGELIYDPTNGTISAGDIVVVKRAE